MQDPYLAITAKSQQGMQTLVRQSFLHVEILGPYVADGLYDLLDSEGTIILPQVWDSVIEPGQTVGMQLWPISDQDNPGKEPTSTAFVPSTTPQADSWAFKFLDGNITPIPSTGQRKPSKSNYPSESAFLHPPEAPRPPPAITEEEWEAHSTPIGKRSKDRSGTLDTSGKSSSDENIESEYAGDSEDDIAESPVFSWQDALQKSSEKHAEEFQRTWDTITEASKAEAEREILRKWLKGSSGSKDQDEKDYQIQTQAKDLIERPKNNDRPATQQLWRQLPVSVPGSTSTNASVLQAPRSLLTLDNRSKSKHDVANALETSSLNAAQSSLCSECQSPLPRVKQAEATPQDIGSPQAPQSSTDEPITAQGPLPQLVDNTSPPPDINRSVGERLDLLEKMLQQQGNVREQAKGEEHLAQLEKTVSQPGNDHAPVPALMTPPITEPALSQSYTPSTAKAPSNNGTGSTTKGKISSARSSFRARLFGRAKSDSGTAR